MKYMILFVLFFSITELKAQYENIEVKVISTKYQDIRGKLMKISPEGIGVEDYKGNYFILRANELLKIKVRKRGLTIGKGAGSGAVIGLSAGALIWSIDEKGENFGDMAALTGALTGAGAIIGTFTGAVAEIANAKFTVIINGDENRFKDLYKTLDPYVNKPLKTHAQLAIGD